MRIGKAVLGALLFGGSVAGCGGQANTPADTGHPAPIDQGTATGGSGGSPAELPTDSGAGLAGDGGASTGELDAATKPVGPETVPSDSGRAIDFVPSAVDATRFPNVCGVMNPPFMNGDLFSLDIIGAMTAPPYDALTLSFNSPPPAAGTPIALSVMDFNPQGTGLMPAMGPTTWYPSQNAAGSGVNFSYTEGTNPAEIDRGAFDSVTFTLVRMPMKDGDPFAVHLRIHFVDGKLLDQTFSAPLTSSWGGCPAG